MQSVCHDKLMEDLLKIEYASATFITSNKIIICRRTYVTLRVKLDMAVDNFQFYSSLKTTEMN